MVSDSPSSELTQHHPLITSYRDTGNGFYIVSRKYPQGDCEMTAIHLTSEDKLHRGGGAKRKNTAKTEMDESTLKKSVLRARTQVRRKLLSMSADRMLTLTFRRNVMDIDEAWKCFKRFARLMRWKYGDRFRYVAVPEYQKRGAVHYHLAIDGFYPVNTVRKLWCQAVGEYEGNIDITSPRKADKNSWNPKRIANYLSKYMTKTDSAEFNRRRYSSGGEIIIPPAMKGWLALGVPVISVMVDAVKSLTRKPIQKLWESEGYFYITHVST